jgi:PAS domain S-box-containing protein
MVEHMNDRTGLQTSHAEMAGMVLSVQDLLDLIPAGAVVVSGGGVVLAVNAELEQQFGYPPGDLVGTSVEMLVPSGLRDGHAAYRSKASESDQMRAMGPGQPLGGQRKDGSVFPIEVGLRAIRTGGSPLILAVVSDRTAQIRAQESIAHEQALGEELAHQEVVAREMAHRVKNLLATITALISLSARNANSALEMGESLRGRIVALSSVIDMAFKAPQAKSAHGPLSIEDILHAVLTPYNWTESENDRFVLTGKPHIVGQRPSEVLALVFHELTTNALKYGALRYADGRIVVDWHQADGRLVLFWRESSPQFLAPVSTTKGFGTMLMSRLVEGEFGGRIDREITADGWVTRLSIPLSALGP